MPPGKYTSSAPCAGLLEGVIEVDVIRLPTKLADDILTLDVPAPARADEPLRGLDYLPRAVGVGHVKMMPSRSGERRRTAGPPTAESSDTRVAQTHHLDVAVVAT